MMREKREKGIQDKPPAAIHKTGHNILHPGKISSSIFPQAIIGNHWCPGRALQERAPDRDLCPGDTDVSPVLANARSYIPSQIFLLPPRGKSNRKIILAFYNFPQDRAQDRRILPYWAVYSRITLQPPE
jgi:hypothetical protein